MARNGNTLSLGEKEELGQLLYQKLLGLTKIHEANKELRQMLSEDMFVKVNQPAFYQVMGYLFRTLDPAEFKRRFFWPLTDKHSEFNFRSSTRDYLKHLNEKHHLNWVDTISYLVMNPGGLKFIIFLLKIVDFVIDQLIKQKERHLMSQRNSLGLDAATNSTPMMPPMTQITQDQLNRLYKRNAFLKEFSKAYIKSIRTSTKSLEGEIDIIKKQLISLAESTDLEKEYVMSKQFTNDLKANVWNVFEERIVKEKNLTEQLNEPLQGLLSTMQEFNEKQNVLKRDVKENQQLLKCLQSVHPQLEQIDKGMDLNSLEGVLGSLIKAYNCLQSEIQTDLRFCNNLENPNIDVVIDHMSDVAIQLQRMEVDVIEFERKLNMKILAREGGAANFLGKPASSSSHLEEPSSLSLVRHTDAAKNLLTKAIHTPPMKLTNVTEKEWRIPQLLGIDRSEEFKVPPDIALTASGDCDGKQSLNRLANFSGISRKTEISNDISSSSVNRNVSNVRRNPLDLLLSHKEKGRLRLLQPELKMEQFEQSSHGILSNITDDVEHPRHPRHLKELDNLPVRELIFSEIKRGGGGGGRGGEGPLTPVRNPQMKLKIDILKLSTSTPMFTPFGSRECSRTMDRTMDRTVDRTMDRSMDNLNRTLLEKQVDCVPNISIVRKMKTISQNTVNLSVSPSGHLEPLNLLQRNSLDNRRLADTSAARKFGIVSLTGESYEEQQQQQQQQPNPDNQQQDDNLKENSANILNTEIATASESRDLSLEIKELADAIQRINLPTSEDNLFDVTDSVLNDVQF